MENQVSPSQLTGVILSPKNINNSPGKREVFKEISNTSQSSSNGDPKLNNASPVLAGNTLRVSPDVSVSKGSDESSDSSLDYGSANEDATNRDDSLVHAFNGIHLSTPKTDGNNIRTNLLSTLLDASVKYECNNSTSEILKSTDKFENVEDLKTCDSQNLRKQKVFNVITECFETPDSSLTIDQTLTTSKENLEVGHDPLNVSFDVGALTFNVPTIDPVIEKSALNINKSIIQETCDADEIAVISSELADVRPSVVVSKSLDDVVERESETNESLNISTKHKQCADNLNPLEIDQIDLNSLANDGIAVLKENATDDLENAPISPDLFIARSDLDAFSPKTSQENDLKLQTSSFSNTREPIGENNSVDIDDVTNTSISQGLSNVQSDIINTLSLDNSVQLNDLKLPNSSFTVQNDGNKDFVNSSETLTTDSISSTLLEKNVDLSTTFEISPHNDVTCEPMECDVSFAEQTSNVIQTLSDTSLSINHQGILSKFPADNSSSTEESEISTTQAPVVYVNEAFTTHDDLEPMDCDDYDAANYIDTNARNSNKFDESILEVSLANEETSNNIKCGDNETTDSKNAIRDVVVETKHNTTAETCTKNIDSEKLAIANASETFCVVLDEPNLESENYKDSMEINFSVPIGQKEEGFENVSNIPKQVNLASPLMDSGKKSMGDFIDSPRYKKSDEIKEYSFIENDVNPFVTKSRIINTPDREMMNNSFTNTPVHSKSIEKNMDTLVISDSKLVLEDIIHNDAQNLAADISNISEEEIPPMVFDNAEIISCEPSPEKNTREQENITNMSKVFSETESVNIHSSFSISDECLDEEFKRPLVLQSEFINTDLDGLDSDSDTLSVSSLTNPFETKSRIANSPDREDPDITLTVNNLNELSDVTLVSQTSEEQILCENNKTLSFDVEGNIINNNGNLVSKVSHKSPTSRVNLSETIVICDTPEPIVNSKSSEAMNDSFNENDSPVYCENTPKSTKSIKDVAENEVPEHNFVPPLVHNKRIKELTKRKIVDTKTANLSPMSRCGDLMGLSPVAHAEDVCANQVDQFTYEDFGRDPFSCDDFEEEFKRRDNFIKDPLDFLLSCGSNPANQYQCKESLLLKFDPLLSTGRVLPSGVRPGRETIPESPRVEEDASTTSGLAESCSSDSSPLSTSISEGKTFGKMSSMDQSLGAPSPKIVNVTPQPVEKPTQVVTPAISTRQPVTSIASKNNPVTPAKSVTSAIAAIDRLISLGGTPPPPPVVVQPKEPEMDPRMLAELQSVRELLARQEEELRKVEDQKQSLETQLSDAVSREQTLIERLNDKKIDRRQMDTVLEEYERTMTQFIGERDVEKRKWDEERIALIRERDEANAHLANMEHSFNDIHAKYERCKAMIQGYKANEEILKETVRSNDDASKKQLERYEHLRQHAMSQLDIANQEIDSVKKSSQAEIIKLQAMLKKSEINVTSLQESLAQKTKDIEELTAICDELIQKVG